MKVAEILTIYIILIFFSFCGLIFILNSDFSIDIDYFEKDDDNITTKIDKIN